ncbi:MAG: hypothetical protein LBP85_01465 [Prevotellaceae bacterium]|jgi:hypothetical protein|nr:hypothetical protein [Prevotellaceae bacterium]
MKKHILIHALFGLTIAAVFSVAVMLLWNWLMPAIFNLKPVNFWQSLGLLALSRVLFGGMIGNRCKMHKYRHCHNHNHLRNKFMKMSSEERKDFLRDKFLKYGFDHDFFPQDESEKHD